VKKWKIQLPSAAPSGCATERHITVHGSHWSSFLATGCWSLFLHQDFTKAVLCRNTGYCPNTRYYIYVYIYMILYMIIYIYDYIYIYIWMGEILPELYCLYHHTFRTQSSSGDWLGSSRSFAAKTCGNVAVGKYHRSSDGVV
jgi:hypothetical protein